MSTCHLLFSAEFQSSTTVNCMKLFKAPLSKERSLENIFPSEILKPIHLIS